MSVRLHAANFLIGSQKEKFVTKHKLEVCTTLMIICLVVLCALIVTTMLQSKEEVIDQYLHLGSAASGLVSALFFLPIPCFLVLGFQLWYRSSPKF